MRMLRQIFGGSNRSSFLINQICIHASHFFSTPSTHLITYDYIDNLIISVSSEDPRQPNSTLISSTFDFQQSPNRETQIHTRQHTIIESIHSNIVLLLSAFSRFTRCGSLALLTSSITRGPKCLQTTGGNIVLGMTKQIMY